MEPGKIVQLAETDYGDLINSTSIVAACPRPPFAIRNGPPVHFKGDFRAADD
ncbi:hypothetical protein QF038_002371 [Pseudarthrobacter sp. W1I19]|nr:hypothetical protein [Pseudarthrobacter sp. W1I19]